MTAEQVLALESRLLDLVPPTGSVGNVTLLRALSAEGWGEEQYWAIRQRIMDSGALVPGRGRGGSVRRAGPNAAPVTAIPVEADIPSDSLPSGAEVLEMQLASGGRLLAVIQGRLVTSDITSLHNLLLSRYSHADVDVEFVSSEPSTSVIEDRLGASAAQSVPDHDDQDEHDFQDDSTADDTFTLTPERRALRDEQVEALVSRVVQSIDPRKNAVRARAVIVARYGLGDEEEQTLDAVGKAHDITREYVRQIEANALSRLARDPDLLQQAKDVLAGWMQRLAASSSATGALLTSRNIEALSDDRAAVDGWIRLALDVAFPMSGAGKLVGQLSALANLALHRYKPFGIDCWVSDPGRVSAAFPIVEAWLEELEADNQALPLPADTFATLLGVGAADVMAVVSAHPRFSVYAGYVFGEEVNKEKKRAVRAHILASHLSPGSAPVTQFTLWQAYRRRFQDIDSCSSNDIRIAMSDRRGAPHLFIVDNNNSLFALGMAATLHGLDLSPRFPDPEPDKLVGTVGQIVGELSHGPATAEAVAERLDIKLEGAISQLGQRLDFVSVTPRYYGLANQAQQMATLSWQDQDLVEEDALEIIGCRQAGEDPQSIYLGWTPAYELALCVKALSNGWKCLPQLLWASRPERWSVPEQEKARWVERKAAEGKPPLAVSPPTGSRLPDAERLLRFLLVIRNQGALSAVMANRVTRPRGPLQQINGTLIAILVRVGALQHDADTYWARHRAGPEAERWYSMLADEYLQNGELKWDSGTCLAMVWEAVSNPGSGWAAAAEWTLRIRSWAAERHVDFEALEARASDINESDETQAAPAEGDDTNVTVDLLPEVEGGQAEGRSAPATLEAVDIAPVAEGLAQLAAQVATDEATAAARVSVSAIDSIAVLIAKAQSGDTEAQYRLARQLQEGVGAAPNPQAAVYWLQRAADARHVPACVRMGRMLLKGEIGGGTRRERQQGLVYLNAGTNAGNATACYLLALAYRDGGLVRKNPSAAMRLLKRAARAGHGNAAYALAVMMRERMDNWVPDTIKLLRLAAGKGVHEAVELLSQVELARGLEVA